MPYITTNHAITYTNFAPKLRSNSSPMILNRKFPPKLSFCQKRLRIIIYPYGLPYKKLFCVLVSIETQNLNPVVLIKSILSSSLLMKSIPAALKSMQQVVQNWEVTGESARIKGWTRFKNGMWHDFCNGIIMRNAECMQNDNCLCLAPILEKMLFKVFPYSFSEAIQVRYFSIFLKVISSLSD